ncbi:hypothetical protein ACLB2K_067558 [Fragaria x ananassa]
MNTQLGSSFISPGFNQLTPMTPGLKSWSSTSRKEVEEGRELNPCASYGPTTFISGYRKGKTQCQSNLQATGATILAQPNNFEAGDREGHFLSSRRTPQLALEEIKKSKTRSTHLLSADLGGLGPGLCWGHMTGL